MCGILGIYGYDDVAPDLVVGLSALQHRGQDAAGLVTFEHKFHAEKALGLVGQVARERGLEEMKGSCGIGHVRYATRGRNDVLNAQPMLVDEPLAIAMAHNGNVNNFEELEQRFAGSARAVLETSCDLELILQVFAHALDKRVHLQLRVDDIFAAVQATQEQVEGAYAAITAIAEQGFLGFNDPHGLRPLVLGRKESAQGPIYAFASESACFDSLGFQLLRDLEPGEAVFIDKERRLHSRILRQAAQAFCVFEYIYFAREASRIYGRSVASERVELGRMLATPVREAGLKPDIVIDVPSSAYFYASGLAEELGVPYRRGLSKSPHAGRSFILPTQAERERLVRQKMNPIADVLRGKKVAVVDDSIVRGTTSRHLVKKLRESGAKEVYFISASPPIKHPCIYGIDMSIKREMIAANASVDEVSAQIGADAVVYQRLEDLRSRAGELKFCDACFSGAYPTQPSLEIMAGIERERREVKAEMS